MFEPRVKNGQTDLLMKALLSLESTDEAYLEKTGASSATISRVNRALLYGANGYTAVLDAMENAAEKEKKD